MDEERKAILTNFAGSTYTLKEILEKGELWDWLNGELKSLCEESRRYFESEECRGFSMSKT